MKRKIAVVALCLLLILSVGGTALADNHWYYARIIKPEATYVADAAKSDNEQNWYINIDLDRVDFNGEADLYFKVRDATYGNRISTAVRFYYGSALSLKSAYNETVYCGQRIYLHGQLDSEEFTDYCYWVVEGEWAP